mmetsp:Transcript_5216/g.11506  ORF Transcript_5216/g.11506 Transcript_5216/m.11506 type:complete len:242 (-) Transcript_5216:388-1113(-)
MQRGLPFALGVERDVCTGADEELSDGGVARGGGNVEVGVAFGISSVDGSVQMVDPTSHRSEVACPASCLHRPIPTRLCGGFTLLYDLWGFHESLSHQSVHGLYLLLQPHHAPLHALSRVGRDVGVGHDEGDGGLDDGHVLGKEALVVAPEAQVGVAGHELAELQVPLGVGGGLGAGVLSGEDADDEVHGAGGENDDGEDKDDVLNTVVLCCLVVVDVADKALPELGEESELEVAVGPDDEP